jgi:subtilisin family serine protease
MRLIALVGLLALVGATLVGRYTITSALANETAQASAEYFADDQVIVTGRDSDINQVIKEVIANGIQLNLIEQFSLSYTDALPSAAPFPFPPSRAELQTRLYRITDGTEVPQVVLNLNRRAADLGLNARAEPNYATGRPPLLAGANPWSVGADPAGSAAEPADDLFRQQWAFGPRGIGLFADDKLTRSVPFTGQAVRVGVFDTSPFSLTKAMTSTLQTIDWITPSLTLSVAHPAPAMTFEAPESAVDVRDHGLFVAGLIHAVAPQSDISLTRVLDEYGRGDLYTLSREVHAFISDTVALSDSFDGAVINLSLGVHPPPDAAQRGLPAEITALETALLSASGFKVVVVGAAGNDGDVDTMQLPASHSTVIGVAASNAQRGRGCFSNLGDIAAPGGNGRTSDCIPTIENCEGNCGVALISLALLNDQTNATGYAYWLGTSFAAPLASGVAALILDARDGDATPAQVANRIYTGALPPNLPPEDTSLGAGIINLRQTLLPQSAYLPLMVRAQ